MGVTDITVYDFDTVSEENMNCQFYPINNIGMKKTLALQSMIEDFTGVYIKIADRWEGQKVSSNILLACADSMQVRKNLYNYFKESPGIGFFCDSRMAAESFMVLSCFDSVSSKAYGISLYSDVEAVQERCTAKATVYCANICAGIMVNQVKKYIVDKTCCQSVITGSLGNGNIDIT